MWTKPYAAAVLTITIITFVAGTLLWISEDEQVLDPYDAHTRGVEDAPIALHTFTDFT